MSIYHASTKPLSRSDGRSAVAAAAYRSGERLVDERTGNLHDYTRRGGVVFTAILTQDGEGAERNQLWNAAEQAEKRKDSRTAREWVIALPHELNPKQRQALALEFGQALVDIYGVAADVAIHKPDKEGDNRNHHAHILTTTRQVSRNQAGELVMGDKADIELSDAKRRSMGLDDVASEITYARKLWEVMANRALEKAGQKARIDCRSLKEQGINRQATVHMGSTATDMERRGIKTDRGDLNRGVAANNELFKQKTVEIVAGREVLGQMEQMRRESERERADAKRKAISEFYAIRSKEIENALSGIELNSSTLSSMIKEKLEKAATLYGSRPDDARSKELREQNADLRRYEQMYKEGQKEQERLKVEQEKTGQLVSQWREAHPVRAWLHDKTWFKAEELKRREDHLRKVSVAKKRSDKETSLALRGSIEESTACDQQAKKEAANEIKSQYKNFDWLREGVENAIDKPNQSYKLQAYAAACEALGIEKFLGKALELERKRQISQQKSRQMEQERVYTPQKARGRSLGDDDHEMTR